MENRAKLLNAGSLEDLKLAGYRVVHGPDRPIAVFYNEGAVCAVEDRCPHMGFPLHRGTCANGVITCPWHHARFDAQSGCTFDLFAGDAAPFDVEVRNGVVWVSSSPRKADIASRAKKRLREGLETANSLAVAKAILTLCQTGTDKDIVREVALFGVSMRDEWSPGLISLTAAANLSPYLSEQTGYLALYQGAQRVASDCQGQPSRRARFPLDNDQIPFSRMREWMHEWVEARHRDGAERTLLTAARTVDQADVTSLLLAAGTQRIYSDTGHVVDFINKALEMLGIAGWEYAERILPAILGRMISARGGEEQMMWRAPDDLAVLSDELCSELAGLVAENDGSRWNDIAGLAQSVLTKDAAGISTALRDAAVAGASAPQLAQAVAYAAGVRAAQFHTANEFSDWLSVLHSFSYSHAVHAMLRRSSDPAGVRGVVHGAYTVFLNRFLNVPKRSLPSKSSQTVVAPEQLLGDLLSSFDERPSDDTAGCIVADYYDQGFPVGALIDTLALAVLQEDFDFHTMQMLEASVAEMSFWPAGEQQRTLLVAAARYIAAFSPTQRTQYQTARIALRLHRGEEIFNEADLQ